MSIMLAGAYMMPAPLLKLNCCVAFHFVCNLSVKSVKMKIKKLVCVGGGGLYTLNIASYSHNASTEWTN